MPVVSIEGMRVMGIDPGLTRCGLSVVQAGRGRSVIPVAVGVVRTPSDSDIAHRLLELSEAANDWLDQYQPDVVAIERIFERGNVSTVMNTAHGVGVLMLAAAQRGIDVHLYTPSEVKKAISGNGRADKKQMTAMITRILGLTEAPQTRRRRRRLGARRLPLLAGPTSYHQPGSRGPRSGPIPPPARNPGPSKTSPPQQTPHHPGRTPSPTPNHNTSTPAAPGVDKLQGTP